MHHRRLSWIWRLLSLAWPLLLSAGEPGTVLGPGATREHVIATFGPPTGQSKFGSKEILTYPPGRVTLNGGRVERIEFKAGVPWPSPPPRPAAVASAATPAPKAEPEGWITDYDQAAASAARRGVNILAYFTGRDVRPEASAAESALIGDGEFRRVFAKAYVLFHADLSDPRTPDHAPDQHHRLRERHGITTFPALLLLSAQGEKLARVDVSRPRADGSYVARVTAAARDAHDLLGLPPLPAPRAAAATAPVAPPAGPPSAATGLMSSAGLALEAVSVGVVVMLGLFWLVWRDWMRPAPPPKPVTVSARIDDAANGLPTYDEIIAWPREKVRAVARRLAEGDGFQADAGPTENDCDLALRREGDPHPRAYVCCSAGRAGIVTVRRVRELFGLLTADGVSAGWYYAPSGFAAEARAFALSHKLTLVDGHMLLARLRDLGPLVLADVLKRAG